MTASDPTVVLMVPLVKALRKPPCDPRGKHLLAEPCGTTCIWTSFVAFMFVEKCGQVNASDFMHTDPWLVRVMNNIEASLASGVLHLNVGVFGNIHLRREAPDLQKNA